MELHCGSANKTVNLFFELDEKTLQEELIVN